MTVFEGEYQYVNLIDGTVSAFVVVDPAKMSKSSKITASIFQCWPILVVTILMTVLAGILIWMAVCMSLLLYNSNINSDNIFEIYSHNDDNDSISLAVVTRLRC